MSARSIRFLEVVFILTAVLTSTPARAATMRIIVKDGAGVGFNDGGPADANSTAGGNNGATIGAQRLKALQFAADIWGALLESSVEITIEAQFGALTCTCRDGGGNVVPCTSPAVTSFSATAGFASPVTVAIGFVNAPKDLTVYPAALANSLAGADLNPQSDISSTFTNVFGSPACPFVKWYYGLNGVLPANSVDFVTTSVHEIGHGLGVTCFMDLASGQRLQGMLDGQPVDLDDPYTMNLEDHSTSKLYPEMTNAERAAANRDTGDLHWVGPAAQAFAPFLTGGVVAPNHIQMYAPATLEIGSSVHHLSNTLTPDQLMEPTISLTFVKHDPGLGLNLLRDVGWRLTPSVTNTQDSGPGSLRNAIAAASSPGIVTLSPALAGQGINLMSSLLVSNKTLLIDGSRAPGVWLNGGGNVRPLVTTSANVAVDGLGFLDGLATAGGGLTGEGGAINGTGNLILRNCTFGRNRAARGGAVFHHAGFSLTVENCTFASNTAEEGGAIYSSGGTLTIRNSTLLRNSGVSLSGGALFCSSTAIDIESCTITANNATRFGGGIDTSAGSLTIRNTILAGNTAPSSGPECRTNGVTAALKGHNFIGSTGGFSFTQESTDVIGVNVATVLKTNANGPLVEDNGGPTMTIQLLPAGAAVDGGNVPTRLRMDQRGASRLLDGNRDAASVIDIGAYELGLPAEFASATVGAGGVVRTNGPAGGATPTDPIETAVSSPNAGAVSILETDSPPCDPTGYELYGQQVLISAPDAAAGNPISTTFWVDLTRVPRNGQGQAIVRVLKDGLGIGSCAAPGQASPSPCISSASIAGDDLVLTIVSTRERSRPSPPCPCEPMIHCPADIVQSSSNPGGVAVNFQPTAEDGCGRSIQVISTPPSGSVFAPGTTVVSCSATSSGGQLVNCSFNVTVNCTDPTITCPTNRTLTTTSAAGAMATFNVTARTGCNGSLPVTCTPPSGSLFPLGTTQVSCEAVDAQSRKATCSFSVTVECQGNPTITCPPNMTVDATLPAGAVANFQATAKDGCGRDLTVQCTPSPGTLFPLGKTTVSCSATDLAGKRSTCTFDVTVACKGAPAITCPQDITLACTSQQGAAVSFQATAKDGCNRTLPVNCVPASGSLFPVGTTTVTCTATDASSRTSQCTFHVTVTCAPVGGGQLPGDCNQDGALDISDGICVLGYLFLGSPSRLPCDAAGGLKLVDWDGRGGIDLSDAVALLSYNFAGGVPHNLGPACRLIEGCPTVCSP